jgi:nucleotide-binding universal stress UspA family protein
VTVPGQYQILEEEIRSHQLRMDLEQTTDTPYREAVIDWYDQVYLPVVRVIRRRSILRYFPGRTETDLYVWISEHRARLREDLGWEIEPEAATTDLTTRFSPRPSQVVARMGERILDAVRPEEVEAGPPPGQWRRERVAAREAKRLFADILVAVDGEETGWCAVDYALFVARHEGARVHGLHVVPAESDLERADVQSIQTAFDRRCAEAGVEGKLVLDAGPVPREVCVRARWTDLVVVSLTYPPAPRPIARLSSGLSSIIRRCPRPVLTVPESSPKLQRALLAYDGSRKAEEALYVATYLATRWSIPLVVITVLEAGHTTSDTLDRARRYLERRGGEATFVKGYGPAAEEIIRTVNVRQCDLIIMGGYGFDPVREIVLGSKVDNVLRKSRQPVLICR